MAIYKYIYWRPDMALNDKGETFANVHLLQGYTEETIEAFQTMAVEMRKTFPQALDSTVRCGRVQKSSSVLNFSVIAFDAYLPKGDYPDWHQVEDSQASYFW